ncbi:MAG: zf-HC2 domain-containing protein, partial [Planctomycetaceae bacterium]|nr:zf-HC2 domain-containing protein [Planctomycetaceae bacterium]
VCRPLAEETQAERIARVMPLDYSDELLSAYLDGELSPAEREQIESHLAADPEARQLLDELRVLSSQVRELPRIAAESEFTERVIQAVRAAEAVRNGELTPGSVARAAALADISAPGKPRRGRRIAAALAGVAAVAAAVAFMVWTFNRPVTIPGGGTVVKNNGIAPQPVDPLAAQKALAILRQAIPQDGDGLVLRIRLGKGQSPSEALDAAFAAAGLGTRKATDESTGAFSIATAYQNKFTEKTAGKLDATLAAADAVFVTAPLDKLEQAIAALATAPRTPTSAGPFEIAPLMCGRVVLEAESEGEFPPTGPPPPKHFAQRLAADKFRLEKTAALLAEIKPPAAPLDPARPIRVLILIEP